MEYVSADEKLNMENSIKLTPKLNVDFTGLSRFPKRFIDQQSIKPCDDDQYLSDLIKVLKVKSLVVGVGGAGNNAVSRLQDVGVTNVNTLNVNTDMYDLYHSNADQKLLIGKEKCKGRGSGNDPSIGMLAAEEDTNRINKLLHADIVFLMCGLGGGTGTGAAPIIAREAKKNNAIVVTFCSIPFRSEGTQKRLKAREGLKRIAEFSDTLIPFPNDNLLELIPNAPIMTCFKVMDEVVVRSIREIMSTVNNCGLMNLDFADVKKVLLKSDDLPSGLIGITESFGNDNDLIKKAKLALNNPLIKPDTNQVNNCLISISGNHQLPLSKVNRIVSTISNDIPNRAELKFGVKMDPELASKIRISVLGKGPVSPYVKYAINP